MYGPERGLVRARGLPDLLPARPQAIREATTSINGRKSGRPGTRIGGRPSVFRHGDHLPEGECRLMWARYTIFSSMAH